MPISVDCRSWVQAARPAAHPLIFIPLLLGQALVIQTGGRDHLSVTFLLYTFLFGVLYQIYLLYVNDHADEAIDKTNEQYWLSGGSRVLPDGKLRSSDLLAGANAALVIMIGLSFYIAAFFERPWMPVGATLAVILCWAYNRRPLQLSYRGHGEIAQGLGCGVLLPLIGFYMQQGTLHGFPWGVLIPLYLIFHAGNIITALPDYRSDKAGGKRTFPVRHGELKARTTVMLLLILALVGVGYVNLPMSPLSLAIILIPSSLIIIVLAISGVLRQANADQFQICKTFVAWATASQAWLLCAWTTAVLAGTLL